nr:hypothetical protein [Tanacetum cinerariifolium]
MAILGSFCSQFEDLFAGENVGVLIEWLKRHIGFCFGIVVSRLGNDGRKLACVYKGELLFLLFCVFIFFYKFLMARLSTDHAALDEYMAIWFRSEVPDTVAMRSTAIMFCKELEESVKSHRVIIDHLEKVRGYPTDGWLTRLKENHDEDLELLAILNVVVARMYAMVHKRDCKDGLLSICSYVCWLLNLVWVLCLLDTMSRVPDIVKVQNVQISAFMVVGFGNFLGASSLSIGSLSAASFILVSPINLGGTCFLDQRSVYILLCCILGVSSVLGELSDSGAVS